MILTVQQHKFLMHLSKLEMTAKPAPTAAMVADALGEGSGQHYDWAHAQLERLRKRGFVQRDGRPARWRLTPEGKAALL